MRVISSWALFVTLPGALQAQQAAPVSESLRDHARRFTEKVVAAAEAMPAESYRYKPTAEEPVFADLLVSAANASEYLCGRITGTRPANHTVVAIDSPKVVLVKRLRETQAYCRRVLGSLDDAGLAEEIQAPTLRSRASSISDAIAVWADLGARVDLYFRLNSRIPPRPCDGIYSEVDCGQGAELCRGKPPIRVTSAELKDGPFSVRSDGRGVYRTEQQNSVFAVASKAAVLLFVAQPRGRPARSITIDLSQPIAGDIGIPRGVVTDSMYLEVAAQWGADSAHRTRHISDIPVGSTVPAAQIDVEFHINGVVHILQMGPQPIGHCYSDRTAVYGTGTTQGTISRPDSTTWIVDLPVGSVGRLFDTHLSYPHAVNKGLYSISLQLILRR